MGAHTPFTQPFNKHTPPSQYFQQACTTLTALTKGTRSIARAAHNKVCTNHSTIFPAGMHRIHGFYSKHAPFQQPLQLRASALWRPSLRKLRHYPRVRHQKQTKWPSALLRRLICRRVYVCACACVCVCVCVHCKKHLCVFLSLGEGDNTTRRRTRARSGAAFIHVVLNVQIVCFTQRHRHDMHATLPKDKPVLSSTQRGLRLPMRAW
jgi:hypothetical protein